MTRVVVVGAGAAGLATAVFAARAGTQLEVIDKGFPAGGSSGLAAGIFNRQTHDPVELELRAWSVAYFGRLEEAGALQLMRTGYVRLGWNEGDRRRFEEALALQAELPGLDGRLIDPDELSRLVPALKTDDVNCGLYGPTDGHLDGHLLCAAYLAELEEAGGQLRPRTELQGASKRNGLWNLETSRGPLTCDAVINAAGAWAPQVGEVLGQPVDIVSERHQTTVAHLGSSPSPPMPVINEYVPGSGSLGLVVKPEQDRKLVVQLHSHELTGAEPEAPDHYSQAVSLDYVEAVAERLDARMPDLPEPTLDAGWAGLYPVAPDGRFKVGPGDDPSVVTVAGLGGVGLTVSAAVGRLAAEWLLDGAPRTFDCAEALLPGNAVGR